MKRATLLLGLGGISLLALTPAGAHGPAWRYAADAAAAQVVPASVSPSEAAALEHVYRLFSDTCHQAPTDLQRETLERAEAIYGVLHEPGGDRSVIEATHAHYRRLRKDYPALCFAWDGNRFHPTDDPPAVDVAVGIARHVLIEVSNTTARALALLPAAPVSVPPGETRALLAPLRADTPEVHQVTVALTDTQAVGVPVRVHAPALIRGIIIDAATGERTPGRIRVRCSDGIVRHGAPTAHIPTLCEKPVIFRPAWQKLPFFYSDGAFEISVPPGTTEITLERGYETSPVTLILDLAEGAQTNVTLSAKRFVDLAGEGWFSGDTHIHWAHNAWDENLGLDLLAMVQRAEDLRVANNLTLYQWRPAESGGPFLKPDQAPMGPVSAYCNGDYHIQMAEEYRNDNHYGHINLLHLNEMVQPIATGPGSGGPPDAYDYPLNRDAILSARAQGGISIEAHNLGPYHCSCVPVHVALGLADSLDQLEPEHYYRFLNCGFHIGLSNGSDHPARTAGSCRVYVKAGRPFAYGNWIEGLRQGRTFTTSGPLLFLTVNGREIGDTLDAPAGTPLTVRAQVLSRNPVGVVELVSNGEVLTSVTTQDTTADIHLELAAEASRWFIVRASRNGDFNALTSPDAGHSSAVYVRVGGREVVREDAVRFWLRNVEQHAERVRTQARFEKDAHRQEALDHIEQGRQVYQQLLDGLPSGQPMPTASPPVPSMVPATGSMALRKQAVQGSTPSVEVQGSTPGT